MNIKTTLCAISLGLVISSGALAGKGNMGDYQFSCQVQTPSQVFGLVMVQADTRTKAADLAARGEATNVNGERESVQHVIECIKTPGETFSDKKFWKYFLEFPR